MAPEHDHRLASSYLDCLACVDAVKARLDESTGQYFGALLSYRSGPAEAQLRAYLRPSQEDYL